MRFWQTLRMIDQNKLDVRTITMGISLLECAPGPVDGLYDRVYDRITRQAENLVPTAKPSSASSVSRSSTSAFPSRPPR